MKRVANEDIGKSVEKRVKLKEDLWGDSDPEFDAYLIQASQQCEEQIAQPEPIRDTNPHTAKHTEDDCNQSLLTSFSMCFAPNNVFASTQIEHSLANPCQRRAASPTRPSSTPKPAVTQSNIYEELKVLKEQLEAKDGEVTILRSQLKQTKEQNGLESSRLANESLTKLNQFRKENEKISSELSFKDLEIANLKQKLANITRSFHDTSILIQAQANQVNTAHSITLRTESKPNNPLEDDFSVVAFSGSNFPLIHVIPNSIFESNADDRFPRLERSKCFSDKRYLHSLVFPEDEEWCEKGVFTLVNPSETLRIKHCFEAIHVLQNSSEEFLETDTHWIGDIYVKTYIFVHNQLEHLTNLAKHIRKDEIRQCEWKKLESDEWNMDCSYDLFQPGAYCKSFENEECAIQCRQCIALLAVALPHSKFLQMLLTNNQSKMRKNQVIDSDLLKSTKLGNEVWKELSFLKLLLKLVTTIEQTRKGIEFIGLLAAICELMRKVMQLKPNKPSIIDLIAKVAKEIVLTIPTYPVLLHMSDFFKEASSNKLLMEQLCSMPSQCQVRKKYKEGVMIVNNLCCTFEMYSALCRKAVKRLTFRDDVDDFRLHLNILAMVTNLISCNVKWLHLYMHDYNYFGCPLECYKLTIDVLYAFSTKFKTRKHLDIRNNPNSMKLIIKQCPNLIAILNHKFGDIIDGKYNSLLRSCEDWLLGLDFDEWHKYAEETLTKRAISDSPSQQDLDWSQLLNKRFQLSLSL